MRSRLLHELLAAGETEQSIRQALTAHDADRARAGETETGARKWLDKQDALFIELHVITGRIKDDLPKPLTTC